MIDEREGKPIGEVIHFNPWRDFNDATPQEDPFGIAPDAEQLAAFLDVVFGYCEGLIPVRGFVDKGQGRDGKPNNIWIDADASAVDKLKTFASWAWREGAALYVIPGTVAAQGQCQRCVMCGRRNPCHRLSWRLRIQIAARAHTYGRRGSRLGNCAEHASHSR